MTEPAPPAAQRGARPVGTRGRSSTLVLHQDDRTHVTDAALATIIGLAAHEVPGVVGMAPAGLGEGLRRILGVSQASEGVEIRRSEAGAERIEVVLHVVVAYGVNIPVVAESVAGRVQHAAQKYAGIAIDDVRVHVAGVSRG